VPAADHHLRHDGGERAERRLRPHLAAKGTAAARSLVAATIVAGCATSTTFKSVLDCSLPHATWGQTGTGVTNGTR